MTRYKLTALLMALILAFSLLIAPAAYADRKNLNEMMENGELARNGGNESPASLFKERSYDDVADILRARSMGLLAYTEDYSVFIAYKYEPNPDDEYERIVEYGKIYLFYGDKEQSFDCRFLTARDPKHLYWMDFDNDGQDELIYHPTVITGTGYRAMELLVLEWENGSFVAHRLSLEDMENSIKERVSVIRSGEQFTITLEDELNKEMRICGKSTDPGNTGVFNVVDYDYSGEIPNIWWIKSTAVFKQNSKGGYDYASLSLAVRNGEYTITDYAESNRAFVNLDCHIYADVRYTGDEFVISNFRLDD